MGNWLKGGHTNPRNATCLHDSWNLTESDGTKSHEKCHCGTETATATREPYTGLWKSELARRAPALKVHRNDGVQVGSKRAHPEQKLFGTLCDDGSQAAGRSLSGTSRWTWGEQLLLVCLVLARGMRNVLWVEER